MGGSFGKYGDAKRKAQIRHSSSERKRYVQRIMHVLHERPAVRRIIFDPTLLPFLHPPFLANKKGPNTSPGHRLVAPCVAT